MEGKLEQRNRENVRKKGVERRKRKRKGKKMKFKLGGNMKGNWRQGKKKNE